MYVLCVWTEIIIIVHYAPGSPKFSPVTHCKICVLVLRNLVSPTVCKLAKVGMVCVSHGEAHDIPSLSVWSWWAERNSCSFLLPFPSHPSPSHAKGSQGRSSQHGNCASSPALRGPEYGMFQNKPMPLLAQQPALPTAMLNLAFRYHEHPHCRISTINVAAECCKTPNSPICVLPPKRENSLHRHSLIWQADSKPYWQPRACFPNPEAKEPKIVPACDMPRRDVARSSVCSL